MKALSWHMLATAGIQCLLTFAAVTVTIIVPSWQLTLADVCQTDITGRRIAVQPLLLITSLTLAWVSGTPVHLCTLLLLIRESDPCH